MACATLENQVRRQHVQERLSPLHSLSASREHLLAWAHDMLAGCEAESSHACTTGAAWIPLQPGVSRASPKHSTLSPWTTAYASSRSSYEVRAPFCTHVHACTCTFTDKQPKGRLNERDTSASQAGRRARVHLDIAKLCAQSPLTKLKPRGTDGQQATIFAEGASAI
eukprot:1136913-Pelagomonas_calceolata.AAC.5